MLTLQRTLDAAVRAMWHVDDDSCYQHDLFSQVLAVGVGIEIGDESIRDMLHRNR